MRVGFVEWPAELEPAGSAWRSIADGIADRSIGLLVTNELPFGRWIAADHPFDPIVAKASVDIHAEGLSALGRLNVPTILSSRPIWSGHRLANEAFVLEGDVIRPVHRKHYFPAEPGWRETDWYRPGDGNFETAETAGLRVGVLLCTDLMFNERARRYGRDGADLIAVPRAVGMSTDTWLVAGRMAAIVSGSYVVSSNRVGLQGGLEFGGAGFAIAPDGSILAMTSRAEPLLVVEVDIVLTEHRRTQYPCYVDEQMKL